MQSNTLFTVKKDGRLLLVILLVHVVCWLAMKPVFPQSDPLCYFLNAKKILSHEYFLTSSVQDHRFGIFIPQAFFIWLFGDSPYSINLWPLLCSLFTITLVYIFLLHAIGKTTSIIASLLLSVNIVQVIYATTAFPDVVVSFFSFSCACIVFRGLQNRSHNISTSLLFLLFFALGFVSKESIVLLIPFIGALFLYFLKYGKPTFFLKSIILLLLFFGGFLFFVSKIISGDFGFFLNSFNNYELFVPLNGFVNLLKRISYEPLLFLNSQLGYSFIFLLGVPAIISGLQKKDFASAESFFALYTLVLLAGLWLGSFSIAHSGYVPITDRRWMMLVAPLCILSAMTMEKIISGSLSKKIFYSLIIALLVLSTANWFLFSIQRGALFALFAATLWLAGRKILQARFNPPVRIACVIFPFVILVIHFILNNSNYVLPRLVP